MRIVLITGMSGPGESVVLNVPEGTGYCCADNLSTQLIPEPTRYLVDQGYMHLDVTTNIHSRESLHKVPGTVAVLRKEHDVCMLFLTTSTTALVQRYSETRRRHPLSIHNGRPGTAANVQATAKGLDTSLIEAIEMKRELLSPLADPARRIDTDTLRTNALRAYIRGFTSDESHDITLMLKSLGFKHGVPTDTNLILDVRSLPNPYCDTQLRSFTRRDRPVIDFLQSQPVVLAMAEDARAYVEKWLLSFIADNHSYLIVAIGYIGGQHRSVYIAERLVTCFRAHGNVLARHRELAVDG